MRSSRLLPVASLPLIAALACGGDDGVTDGGAGDGATSESGSEEADATSSGGDADDGASETGVGDDGDTGAPLEVEAITVEVPPWTFDARAVGPADGELVLLLHGFPQTSYEWIDVMVPLAEAGYRVVAPNQRGYSAAARPPEIADYEAALLIEDVLGMATALEADTFHLGGHDWGAIIAWGVAAAAPDRVETLTAVSIPHPDAFAAELMDTGSCQYEASAYFEFFASTGAENIFLANDAALLQDAWTDSSPEAIADYLAVLGSPEALGAALNWYRANIVDRMVVAPPTGTVSVPTLFLWSDGDDAVCVEGAEATENYVSGPYTFEVVAGVSHWVPEAAAGEVSAAMLTLLAG